MEHVERVALAYDFERSGDRLISVAEAAELARVKPRTVRGWCASGRLQAAPGPASGELRVRRADVERLAAKRASGGGSQRPEKGASGGGSRRPEKGASRGGSRRAAKPVHRPPAPADRADILRRIAAEVSGQLDLPLLFEDVITESLALFGAQRAGLWRYDATEYPFTLAAQHALDAGTIERVARVHRDADAAGLRAIRERRVVVLGETSFETTVEELRSAYVSQGVRTVCLIPIVFRDEPLGLLAIYHETVYDWSPRELDLVGAFADHMATAIGNARLYESVQALAARLRAIQDLGVRLDRFQDPEAIGRTIVDEALSLIEVDSARIYRVDRESGWCEPVAFRGRFLGSEAPDSALLRMRIGQGLTGWVAAHGEPILTGDALKDPRSVLVGKNEGPESLLVVPMTYDEDVRGVIVLSKLGRDRFTEDDVTILSIFAGYAAQAFVNAEAMAQVRSQQGELEHRLASQRRLLEVNEQLLSTLDPRGVLEMIADSLGSVVRYDNLTIYRVDRPAGVRRAVVARDLFAEVILDYAAPLTGGITGWVIEHGQAVLANDAHRDERSEQIPGTPFEPESVILVPLIVGGEVIGTLNVGRVGETDAHFSEDEFELTKLFAAQASIALQNAEAHRAVARRAEEDALTGLRNHGAFQAELAALLAGAEGAPFSLLMLDLNSFKAYNDAHGHPAGDRLLARVAEAITGATRDGDRAYRYGGDEFAVVLPGARRAQAVDVADRIKRAIDGLEIPSGPAVSVSVGIACYPVDGATKGDLVDAADQALYLAKPLPGGPTEEAVPRDAYLAALHDTALALMDRGDMTSLLETIMSRATGLMGTPHGYIYLLEPDGKTLLGHVGTGLFEVFVGYRLTLDEGVGGLTVRSGRAVVVRDYDTWEGRIPNLPPSRYGAVVGVPLRSGSRVVGVIGLASGDLDITFRERDIAVLERFAQLASIALENARLLEAVQSSEDRFRRLSDATREAVAIHREGTILEVNGAFCRLLGLAEQEIVGRSVLDFIAPESREVALALPAGEADAPLALLGLRPDGTVFPVEVTARPLTYADGAPARVVTIRDLRERRALEEQLSQQAVTDALTGLPNREQLVERATEALATISSPGAEASGLALLMLDLDRFQLINDSLGHSIGDDILNLVAQRLVDLLRPGDTVARFGGDEFALLVDGVAGEVDAHRVAERLEGAFAEPFHVSGTEAYLTASIGIALGRRGEMAAGELVRDAEIALYRAKAAGGARLAFYEQAMSDATHDRHALEQDLRRAIERDELRLHFQPIVALSTRRIVGIEALVRWEHPTRGLVLPGDFIPLAEETGLIRRLGRWVLATACRKAQEWLTDRPDDDPIAVSVNLSAREFGRADLVDEVAGVLADTGLPPRRLEIEITESSLMDRSEAVVHSVAALRGLGVGLVLDDFGTGYSSLANLRSLPLDGIKIDRTFVAGLGRGEPTADGSIAAAVIALAHGLGIGVVAEGIETEEQAAALLALGCDRGQGYLFARPLPPAKVATLLGRGSIG